MYYENGYEAIGELSVRDLYGSERAALEIPVLYLDMPSRLYIIGDPESAAKAIGFLHENLSSCRSGASEFALHFMCENLFGVKIVRMLSRQMTA